MYFYCRIYFTIITDLAIICVKFNMQIEGNFAHAQLGFQDDHADTVATYLVYCKMANKCLINWKICAVNPPTLTFLEFYKQESSVSNRRLATVFVGKSKEDCSSEVLNFLYIILYHAFTSFYTLQLINY